MYEDTQKRLLEGRQECEMPLRNKSASLALNFNTEEELYYEK